MGQPRIHETLSQINRQTDRRTNGQMDGWQQHTHKFSPLGTILCTILFQQIVTYVLIYSLLIKYIWFIIIHKSMACSRFLCVLGIKPRDLFIPDKCSTTELPPQP